MSPLRPAPTMNGAALGQSARQISKPKRAPAPGLRLVASAVTALSAPAELPKTKPGFRYPCCGYLLATSRAHASSTPAS
jgi:hypothetical protein